MHDENNATPIPIVTLESGPDVERSEHIEVSAIPESAAVAEKPEPSVIIETLENTGDAEIPVLSNPNKDPLSQIQTSPVHAESEAQPANLVFTAPAEPFSVTDSVESTGLSEVTASMEMATSSKMTNRVEQGITSLNELKSLEVLRTEFASSTFKPKVILSYETISFNKACVKLLPETRYVNVLIDRAKKRIIILPVNRHAKDALQWCGITRDGDVRKRVCTAKKFGEKLYDMMQWIKENKYRVLAYYQEIEGVRLLVFNLRECEMVVPDFITTTTGKIIKRGRVYLPGEWENGFGMPLLQHNEANAVELDAHYTLSDKDMDVTITDVRVRGKVPMEEEIIMSQYRKEKPQEVFVNA